jgi:site-specific DNA-cytosine methylase
LELFAGIGGLAAAWPAADIVGAVEIDRDANEVYRLNFGKECEPTEIVTLPNAWLAEQAADVWWMSPPCTPFTRRGLQRDLEDPRNRALLKLIDSITAIRPERILIENVRGFETSRTMQLLQKCLGPAGYEFAWRELCPSMLGWPNRRPRVYIICSRVGLTPWRDLPQFKTTLRKLLAASAVNDDEREQLRLDPILEKQYEFALDRVNCDDRAAMTACFTRAYGKSIVRSGSYLQESGGLRRFSPKEVAVLMGFPADWQWPKNMPTRRRWQLLGNSLSQPALKYVLEHV